MKRQHPTDPNLFWCPKCGTYKARGEFGVCRNKKLGIQGFCKECSHNAFKQWCISSNKHKEYMKKWRSENIDKCREHSKRAYNKHSKERNLKSALYNKNHPVQVRETMRRNYIKYRGDRLKQSKVCFRERKELLMDVYIKMLLKEQGLFVSPATVDLKRQQIVLWRNIKQLKEAANGLNK